MRDVPVRHLRDAAGFSMHLTVTVGEYTVFFTRIRHGRKGAQIYRHDNPLMTNYKYVRLPTTAALRDLDVRIGKDDADPLNAS